MTPPKIVDALNQQFTSVFTSTDTAPLLTLPHYIINTHMSPIILDEAEFASCLKKLNPKKSVGPDLIYPQLLSQSPSILLSSKFFFLMQQLGKDKGVSFLCCFN